jgi:hypothetical protein
VFPEGLFVQPVDCFARRGPAQRLNEPLSQQKIEQNLLSGPIPQMSALRSRNHLCAPFSRVAAVLWGLTVADPAWAQQVAAISADAGVTKTQDAVPTLTLRIEGEATVSPEKLRSELELATGKAVTLDDEGSGGTVVVTFHADTSRVTIVYQPPLAELTRTDTLPSGQLESAHHIGLLTQGLIQRDAGITLLAPTPNAPIADAALGSCAQSSELARPVSFTAQAEVKDGVKKTSTAPRARPPVSDDESWRGALGLHWGPLGFGIATGEFAPPGLENLGSAVSLDAGGSWLVGGTFHVDVPSASRFKFGVEAFLDQYSIEGQDEALATQTVSGTNIGLSIAPSVRLTSLTAFAELRIGIGIGLAYSPALDISSSTQNTILFDGALGYRLGGAVSGTGWVTQSLGVTLALGFDHTFVTGRSFTLVDPAPSTVEGPASKDGTTELWMNQPYLRIAAEYRL